MTTFKFNIEQFIVKTNEIISNDSIIKDRLDILDSDGNGYIICGMENLKKAEGFVNRHINYIPQK